MAGQMKREDVDLEKDKHARHSERSEEFSPDSLITLGILVIQALLERFLSRAAAGSG
jgi:hypothetical protein